MDSSEALKDLIEIRELLKSGDISPSYASEALQTKRGEVIPPHISVDPESENSQLKSFLVNFNVNNFADCTVIINSDNSSNQFIECAGDKGLINEIGLRLDSDSFFFRGTDEFESLEVPYKLLHETMELDSMFYTVLTLTSSTHFRPSSFHILCDIIMDLIRLYNLKSKPVFNDFFESVIVDLNRLMSELNNDPEKIYMYKFNHLDSLFGNIGMSSVLELSDCIVSTLQKFYGDNAGIFKISLTVFIVVTERNDQPGGLEYSEKGLNFLYRGIVLPYTCMGIPYETGSTVYTIFEKIFMINSYHAVENHFE